MFNNSEKPKNWKYLWSTFVYHYFLSYFFHVLGIVNCGTVASGIVAACKENPLKVPMIVRLQGTNSEAAKKIMEESGLPVKLITDADEAAKAAVEAAKGK